MEYIFKGNLRGFYCGDCFDFLYKAKVKIYAASGDRITAQAIASNKETFHQRSGEELKAIEPLLLAEAETDERGDFTVRLSDKNYKGGAFDVDFECGTVPVAVQFKNPPKPKGPLQFNVTTTQPVWTGDTATTQGLQKAFAAYTISSNFWCRLLHLFKVYVVCGIITNCKNGEAFPGLKVKAYDVDLLQDDYLGEAYTDAAGQFKIYFTEADFSKTIFSWLNVEWPAGPDLFFSVESSSGSILLQEDRQTGHRQDRENRPNCTCVKLCVDGIIPETPWFTHVGNFNISADLTAGGKTIGARTGAGGVGYGFFGAMKLKGYATKKVPSAPASPLYYRFMYSTDNGGTYQPILASHLLQTEFTVASRLVPWGPSGNMFQDVVIDVTQAPSVADSLPVYDASPAPPKHILNLDANGWVRVDQVCMDNGFLGTLLYINSHALVPGGAAPGDGPGVPVSAPKNGTLTLIKFQTTDDPSNPASVHFHEQVITARLLINNWSEVTQITIDELFGGGLSGCNPIATNAHVKYTVDHEFCGPWSITAYSAAIPGGITGLPFDNAPVRGVANTIDLATHAGLSPVFPAGWPSCAYSMSLNTIRKLTNGEQNDTGRGNPIIFCR